MFRVLLLLAVALPATETRLFSMPATAKKAARKTATKKAPPKKKAAPKHLTCAEKIEAGIINLPLQNPPPVELAGSCEAQIWANQIMDKDHYTRVDTDKQLRKLVEDVKLFGPIPSLKHFKVDPRLGNRWSPILKRRYKNLVRAVRLPVRLALTDLNDSFEEFSKDKHFRQDFFVIDSMVRSRPYLRLLSLENGNTAALSGPAESGHLAGSTIDITKVGLDERQIEWLREQLLKLEAAGVAQATEEFQQAVFHVTIFESYASGRPTL